MKGFAPTFDRDVGREVNVGDYLMAINGFDLKGVSVDDVVARIQSTPPPRTMDFLRITDLDGKLPRPPPNAIVYTVAVPKDTIGLQLAETPKGLAVRGYAPGFDLVVLKDVRVGDFLVAVNDQPAGNSLAGLVKLLARFEPPRKLRFVRVDGVLKRERKGPPPGAIAEPSDYSAAVAAGAPGPAGSAPPPPPKMLKTFLPGVTVHAGDSLARRLALANDDMGSDSDSSAAKSDFSEDRRKKRGGDDDGEEQSYYDGSDDEDGGAASQRRQKDEDDDKFDVCDDNVWPMPGDSPVLTDHCAVRPGVRADAIRRGATIKPCVSPWLQDRELCGMSGLYADRGGASGQEARETVPERVEGRRQSVCAATVLHMLNTTCLRTSMIIVAQYRVFLLCLIVTPQGSGRL